MKKSITSNGSSTARTDAAPRKLTLGRQTLRRLTALELAEVVGGTQFELRPTDSCVSCATGC